MNQPDFWADQGSAQKLLKKRAQLAGPLEGFDRLSTRVKETLEMLELASDEAEESMLPDLETELAALTVDIDGYELTTLLSDPSDQANAIVSINPGAGGVDAKDWASMLVRMYLRWCERRGFTSNLVEYQDEEDGGIGSATLIIEGERAYGWLKGEGGVHRLVRISPFDSAHRRHTAFAAVFVIPEVEDDEEVVIEDADIRIDLFRAGGHGGQHVNKTDSAVRITHIPTGIVVTCSNEKSQHRNKATAMKIVKSRLYEKKLDEERAKQDVLHHQKKEISWGSQIRTYTLQPYRLVKDHRTGMEVGNVDAVLDGQIDRFIETYLMASASGHESS